jgi:hypothetical protein
MHILVRAEYLQSVFDVALVSLLLNHTLFTEVEQSGL